ncbi:M50 family metallopeptidase [Granulosicoccus antarcticus]|uniref:Peptidase M50 domain-containing protein n=1 Tax=Granulosicoccus antarcticus IMCC3135 TaxID=1192854 RepID=A0A2Z2NLG2_9GAMM|nr:M50 family metallopeptidase [Granulosicoccus antarcticus]ASJ70628.1 hypothetical protein IMCC3135_02575 [Granulosicoccus antarcticus IMCC3135]
MKQDPLFSEHWYRVKDLKLRLASDVVVYRHRYRKVPCFVLHRKSTSAYHRVDTAVFKMIAELDGSVTLDSVWQRALEIQGNQAPTQPQLIGLLARMHEAELLSVNRKLDAEQLFSRSKDNARKDARQRYLNPLFLKFTLFDPDRLLNLLQPLARCLFSRTALVIWVGLLVLSLFLLLPRWASLRYEVASFDMFSAGNLVLFLSLYPALKLVHELAHGLAIKRFGGEVHELGIALMVFLPLPYVDASAASVLPDKWHRMLISAAGILVELAVAAIATLVWCFSDGLLHDLALMLMLIGGGSTLLFNGNPLLKFDGYYILSDAVEIPNLADRSRQYLLGLARHKLFGMPSQQTPLADRAEGVWLILYGLLSSTYKLAIMFAIALMLSEKFFFFGTAMAIWVVVSLVGLPLWKLLKFVAVTPQSSRPRAIVVTASFFVLSAMTVTYLPLPLNTVSRGVVWLPENAIVRVQSLCEVTQVRVLSGATVTLGEPLFYCEDPQLETEQDILQAQLDQLEAVRTGLDLSDRVDHEKYGHEIETLQVKLKHIDDNIARQLVTAQSAGRFFFTDNTTLEGQFLTPAALAAYVVPSHARTVRIAIEQADASWFQQGETEAELRFDEQAGKRQVYQTRIHRQTPQSTSVVPSAGLTTAGGGELVADSAGDGRTVLESVFDIELAWPENAPHLNVGSHVSVVFRHASRPILSRLVVIMQRAFLGRQDV